MLTEIRRIYRESQKPADSLFNRYVARPPAAVVVTALARTRATPNQVTFLSLAVFLAAAVVFATVPGPLGLWLGVGLVELSYIFDCADGQLARVTGRSSPVGALLDFLMDELKAYLLVASVALRLAHLEHQGEQALWLGLGGLVVVGSALSLTKFMRSPEYAAATGARVLKHGEAAGASHDRTNPMWPLLLVFRSISQYPTTLPIFAAFGRLDVFLWAYVGVHLLYVGQSSLILLLRLGRSAPRSAPP